MRLTLIATALVFGAAAPVTAADAAVAVDPGIAAYVPAAGVSGKLTSIGSDTLNNLMTYWAEGFMARYPNVKIQVEGKGSSTAPPALMEGASQLGPMSREMTKAEIDAFTKRFGYAPTKIEVSVDALAVFVHKDNPVAQLSLTQVDSIFSSTFKRGGKNIGAWGDVGLTGDWATKAISMYGRNSASGTYGFFKEHALKKGDFKATVKEQPGSSAVVQAVANDLAGVGYSGIGYVTAGVKPVPLSEKDGAEAITPSYENCLNGTYPMWRFLYIYVNKKPNAPLEPLTGEFIKYVLSKDGQEIVVKDGYYPMPKAKVDEFVALIAK